MITKSEIKAAAAEMVEWGMVYRNDGCGESLVWICDLAYYLIAAHPEMTLAEIRSAIANSGVTLSRADLVGVLDPVKVAASRVESRYVHHGVAHYVVVFH